MAVDALKGVERCYKFGYPCKYAFRFEQNPKIVGCIKRWGIVFVMFQRARKANGNSFIACGPADHWKEKHINIDLFGRMLPDKGKRYVKIITHFFSAIVCLFLAKAAWVFIMEEREMATTLFNDIPSWYFQLILPVGFF